MCIDDNEHNEELNMRMLLPQRHRLLHGYPMSIWMDRVEPGVRAPLALEETRPLLVGVLPHSSCNPRVKGCGFCTFPHERFRKEDVLQVVRGVCEEIHQSADRLPNLQQKRVDGLYFGGGTANLTPAPAFERLCRVLGSHFDFSQAEATLEGVPRYFSKGDYELLRIMMDHLPARHHRVSMGVQSFDVDYIKMMGRQAFGDFKDISAVIGFAHEMEMTVSLDLLINLPG
ncbi:MAG: Fe-S oxidoreductase, partial [Proteobacteria bacterium]|nr:Fe-S oxidoreductase [Pseudomonadota bacterium]